MIAYHWLFLLHHLRREESIVAGNSKILHEFLVDIFIWINKMTFDIDDMAVGVQAAVQDERFLRHVL